METPLALNPFSGSLNTPSVHVYDEKCGPNAVCPPNVFAAAGGPFPIVCTTYRVTEHWQAGMMTRNLPWLNELMPEPFVEMSEELAAAKGIENGQEVKVITIRGTVKLKAAVTKRLKPFKINGGEVHEVGVIWHWGYCGGSKGASANLLTPHVGDVNTRIPEFKAFLCEIEKA
jgi:anaerobic selenocysteine-containing dehydrogenase